MNASSGTPAVQPKALRDLVNVPPGLAVFFQNYKIKVTNLAWLTPQQMALLTGDFRAFVEALCEMREKGRITGIDQPVKYLDEMLALLAATTNTPSFNLIDKSDFKGGQTTMCEIMERWENQLRSEGYKTGQQDGFESGKQIGFENGKQIGFESGFADGEKFSAVKTCKNFGKSQTETCGYLMQQYHLTESQANETIKQFW